MGKLASSDDYKDKVIFLMVNTLGAPEVKQKGFLSDAIIRAGCHPPAEYGLKSLPHKVVIDKTGKVIKNFDDVVLNSDIKTALQAGVTTDQGSAPASATIDQGSAPTTQSCSSCGTS
eukprot:gnl/MRDRNA2_/MRDRNA2_222618_c0_seq1.p1 gnl/MRDRNA2_/MRDRNA2_222618_c0~~gnl/MRDRNA2_/MRDRNA2_222618_c0_seq1.p1  ORF type:complete len:117 (-),score=7.59 gnl/MRDRNA2_/MRDRNA2_222618_c0_seq1:39-389(-)